MTKELFNIKIDVGNTALARLLLEQIGFSKLYTTQDQLPADLTIYDDAGAAPSYAGLSLLVPRGQVRLGDVMDRVHYKFSRRAEKLAGDEDCIDVGFGLFFPADNQITGKASHSNDTVRLTEKERAMLEILYRAGADGVARQDLLTRVWGYVAGTETHTLETHMYRLRQKLGALGAQDSIEAVDGRYRFVWPTS